MPATTENLDFLSKSRHNPSFFEVNERLGGIIDYCVPANPYFPSTVMYQSLVKELPSLLKYYPDHGPASGSILSQLTGINQANLIAANGSTEIITFLINSQMPGPMVCPIPTFGRWTDLPIDIGHTLVTYQLKSSQKFELLVDDLVAFTKKTNARSLVICNPNNPTGGLTPKKDILEIISRLQHLDLIVIDESFMPFANDPELDSIEREAPDLPNVVVVKSLGKALGWHGVRLGYAVANRTLIEKFRPHVPYWNINGIASFALNLILNNREEYRASLQKVVEDREYLESELRSVPGLNVFPTQCNFAFFRIPAQMDGVALRNRLASEHKLFVRECGNKIGSCHTFFRVAARPKADTDILTKALRNTLSTVSSNHS